VTHCTVVGQFEKSPMAATDAGLSQFSGPHTPGAAALTDQIQITTCAAVVARMNATPSFPSKSNESLAERASLLIVSHVQ
jgi:hypothetical protein